MELPSIAVEANASAVQDACCCAKVHQVRPQKVFLSHRKHQVGDKSSMSVTYEVLRLDSTWGRLTLLILAVEQTAEVNKLLVGDVFVVDAHSLPLATEEVGGVDSTSTAAIHCVKALPAAT